MDPLSLARYGMMTAASRLAASARQTVSGESDAVRATVGQIEARQQFVASAKTIGIADDMWRVLLALPAS
jgi:hypothetical protein